MMTLSIGLQHCFRPVQLLSETRKLIYNKSIVMVLNSHVVSARCTAAARGEPLEFCSSRVDTLHCTCIVYNRDCTMRYVFYHRRFGHSGHVTEASVLYFLQLVWASRLLLRPS